MWVLTDFVTLTPLQTSYKKLFTTLLSLIIITISVNDPQINQGHGF